MPRGDKVSVIWSRDKMSYIWKVAPQGQTPIWDGRKSKYTLADSHEDRGWNKDAILIGKGEGTGGLGMYEFDCLDLKLSV